MKYSIKKAQIPLHIVLIIFSLVSILPFILLFMSSFTDEKALIASGYRFIPAKFSLDAYQYLFSQIEMISNAFFISVFVTFVGTAASLFITTTLSYVISRNDYPAHNVFSFLVFFTMLFNGGLVPTYLMYTQFFGFKNTIFSLIIPSLLMSGFNVLIMKSYFATNIPKSVLESAYVDGAGELRTFFQIALPLALPIIATIGLFIGVGYWNDWTNGLYYLTDAKLFSLQNVLNRILSDAQFLSQNSFGTQTGEAASKIPTAGVRMAIAVVGAVPILLIFPFFQKYFVKGIAIGAVKG